MEHFLSVTLNFIFQFTGGRDGIEDGAVSFGLAALLWAILLGFASWRRGPRQPREKLLVRAFALELGQELLMLGDVYLQALGAGHSMALRAVLPPLENAFTSIAMVTLAAAFLCFLNRQWLRQYLRTAIAAIVLCYLATFWWWAGYLIAHPGARFDQTWCDWLFRFNAGFWLLIPVAILFRRRNDWQGRATGGALLLFWLHDVLKIPDLTLQARYEIVLAPLRQSCYLAAIGLIGFLYLREQAEQRDRAEGDLREKNAMLQTILDSIPAPVFYKDKEGIYLGCNIAFEKFLGRSRQEIVGQSVYGVSPSDLARVYHEADLELMRQGGTQIYEAQVAAADGMRHDVIFHKAAFMKVDGNTGGLVGTLLDISERKRAEEKVRRLAYFDSTTGLPNRTLFMDRLERALTHAEREAHRLALLFLDLDRFKDINETLGHPAGDRLLAAVAERLGTCLRGSDTMARFGGDEFVFLLSTVKDEGGAAVVAEKLIDLMARPFALDGHEIFLSVSIGIVMFPNDGQDGAALLSHADMAMYAAKERGKSTLNFFSPELQRRAVERHELVRGFRRALQQKEFFLEFQPQVNVGSGRVMGVEALLRWRHPTRGLIPPAAFIHLAEDTGHIRAIGEWALRAACTQGRLWQEMGMTSLRIGVNISGCQLRQRGFLEMIDRVLADTGLDSRLLELELTESVLMEQTEAVIGVLTGLRMRGIHLALDDFGTGYSSLNYLKHFPIDRIKIDKSFVRDLADHDSAAIIDSILAIARTLNLRVVAEGVETSDQLNHLLARHCHEMQGFYFAAPLPAEEVAAFCRRYPGAEKAGAAVLAVSGRRR